MLEIDQLNFTIKSQMEIIENEGKTSIIESEKNINYGISVC